MKRAFRNPLDDESIGARAIGNAVLVALSIVLAGLAFAALARGGEPKEYRRAESAVVRIGGCSGVCVDPSGIVLTAKHCQLGAQATVYFRSNSAPPDSKENPGELADRIYVGPDGDDVMAFQIQNPSQRMNPFPAVKVRAEPLNIGDACWSAGYPSGVLGREFKTASGKLSLVKKVRYEDRGVRSAPFPVNETDFQTGPGWSGGPLFDPEGQVIGLCGAGDSTGTDWISWGSVRRAYQAAQGQRPHLYFFGYHGCPPCDRGWAAVLAGDFGRVIDASRVKDGIVVTETYTIEYVDVTTPEGGETYDKLIEAIEAATKKPVDKKGNVPAFHVEGRAAIHIGYDAGAKPWMRVLGWAGETLRLPVTLAEGIFGGGGGGQAAAPIPSAPAAVPIPKADLGKPGPVMPPADSRAGDGIAPTPAPEPPLVPLGESESPSIIKTLVAAAVARELGKVESTIDSRIDVKFGEDSFVGSIVHKAADGVLAKVEAKIGPAKESDPVRMPWEGGLGGMALAGGEWWLKRKLAKLRGAA